MRSLSLSFGLLLLAAGGGCTGDLHELGAADASTDGPGGDGSGSGGSDGSGGPAAVGFETIQADLDALGCSGAGACHGGSAPMSVTAMPPSASARMANWDAVRMRAMSGAASLLLTKPLATSGVGHAGSKPFASTSDATYARWAAWIAAGAPFAVSSGAVDGGASSDGSSNADGGSR